MAARTASQQQKASQQTINDELFTTMLPEFDWKETAVKFAIGYAYVIVGYIASWNIAVVIALVTNIIWLQYVIAFAVFAVLLGGLFVSTPFVANSTYDAGAKLGAFAGKFFAKAKEKVQSFRTPAEATVH